MGQGIGTRHNGSENGMMEPELFFDLRDTDLEPLIRPGQPVWAVLDGLKDFLADLFRDACPLAGFTGQVEKPLAVFNGDVLDDVQLRAEGPGNVIQAYSNGRVLEGAAVIMPGAYLYDDRILVGAGTVVEPGAMIKGPTVIGRGSEVRQGAYIRGDCWVGDGCVVGHTTEIKGSVMMHGSKAGHFAYIGDSILGRDVNLGAGTKLANLKMIAGTVSIVSGQERFDTGRRKIGAILGDRTETGCNSVTSPGTLMGPRSIVYPGVTVPGGYYPARTLVAPSRGSLKIHNPRVRD
jgi:acetyltransferase-like isoleucine patch superfamily enzyme